MPYLARIGPTPRGVASWVGVALIGYVRAGLRPRHAFPGYAAAVPVVGAALLLVGGNGAVRRWGPQGLLSVAPMRAIGDWSYSLYLWHWPLIIVAAYIWEPVSGWRGVALLVVATALSAATYRWVETPFRVATVLTKKERGRTRSLLLYPATILVVLPSVAVANHVVESNVTDGGPAISLVRLRPGARRPEAEVQQGPLRRAGRGVGAGRAERHGDPRQPLAQPARPQGERPRPGGLRVLRRTEGRPLALPARRRRRRPARWS